jgi:hypothetical protein
MISHPRLGQASRWSGLDANLISEIWSLLREERERKRERGRERERERAFIRKQCP